MIILSVWSMAEFCSVFRYFSRFLCGAGGDCQAWLRAPAGRDTIAVLEGRMPGKTTPGGRFWLAAAALALALALLGPAAQARGIKAPWEPLPADAKLVTDPAVLTALFADH